MRNNYDLCIFDFDGTLFDTRDSMPIIFKKSLETIGREISPELAKDLMHYSLVDSFKILHIDTEEEQWKVYLAVLEWLDAPEVLALTKPFPEAKIVLDSLSSEGKRIAIMSSNTEKHIRLALEAHHLEQYGKIVIGAKEGRKTKPNPDPLLDCLAAANHSDKSTAVYIGDSLQDMECARRAGVDGILVERYGEYPSYEGEKIDNLLDLL